MLNPLVEDYIPGVHTYAAIVAICNTLKDSDAVVRQMREDDLIQPGDEVYQFASGKFFVVHIASANAAK